MGCKIELQIIKKYVIANQSADWCGNPFCESPDSEGLDAFRDTDCHVALRAPRNDIF